MTTAPHWDLRRRDFHPQVQQIASLHLPAPHPPFTAAPLLCGHLGEATGAGATSILQRSLSLQDAGLPKSEWTTTVVGSSGEPFEVGDTFRTTFVFVRRDLKSEAGLIVCGHELTMDDMFATMLLFGADH